MTHFFGFSRLDDPMGACRANEEYLHDKYQSFRKFSKVSVFSSAAYFGLLWFWDYSLDPAGAMQTVELRAGGALFICMAAAGSFNARFSWLGFLCYLAAIVAAEALFFKILSMLESGLMVGTGSILYFYLIVPLTGLSLSKPLNILSILLIGAVPLGLYLGGVNQALDPALVCLFTVPATIISLVSVVLFDSLHRKAFDYRKEAEWQAHRDPLTGLYNRRYFFDRATSIITTVKEEGRRLSLAVIDIDHFKRINDRFGHVAGDRVLKQVAMKMQDHLRGQDILSRIGGEEFAMLVPDTDLSGASAIADRVRRVIADSPLVIDGAAIPVTVSIGFASLSNASESIDTLYEQADIALYRAKSAGRNTSIAFVNDPAFWRPSSDCRPVGDPAPVS